MENIAFAVFLYFLVTMLTGNKKKRKPSPPEQRELPPTEDMGASHGGIDFKIPHLEGAPPLPSCDAIRREEAGPPLQQRTPSTERESCPARGGDPVPGGQPDGKARPILLEPQTALQAIAMAEILNRPKAYRNLRRR